MIVKISILAHFTRFLIACLSFQDTIETKKKKSLCKLHYEDMLRRKYTAYSLPNRSANVKWKIKLAKMVWKKKKREKEGKWRMKLFLQFRDVYYFFFLAIHRIFRYLFFMFKRILKFISCSRVKFACIQLDA